MSDPVFERYKEALKAGHVAVMRGKPKDALAHYAEAAKLAGHRPLPYVSMGGVLLKMGRAAEALVAYDDALVRDPEDAAALSGRAAALLAAGRREEAAEALARVTELENEIARRRSELTAARAETVLREADPETLLAAADESQRAGELAASVAAYVAAAQAYGRRDEHDAALDACLRAMSVSLGAPRIHLEMARRYFARGWSTLGIERVLLLERLLGLEDDPEARSQLAELARERAAEDSRLAAIAAAASAGGSTAAGTMGGPSR